MMSYPEQLETQEWSSKRLSILERDNYTCQFCHRKQTWCVSLGDKFFHIGEDTSYRLTKKNIQMNTISLQASSNRTYPIQMLENVDTSIALCKVYEDYIIGVTDRGVVFYAIENNMKVFKENMGKKVYKVVRAKIPNFRYVFIYYLMDSDLQEIDFPVFYCTEDMVKLNVHHKYYIFGKNAWEYGDDLLITLCDRCHYQIHKCSNVEIYTYKNGLQVAMKYTPCKRCGGVGYFPEYKKVENGICFRCRGNRYEELIPETSFNQSK